MSSRMLSLLLRVSTGCIALATAFSGGSGAGLPLLLPLNLVAPSVVSGSHHAVDKPSELLQPEDDDVGEAVDAV
jgi:hypothetical protein